ncbi:hypothetical protein GOACH_13_00150 [Gordonia aichiensis NBRC 108223]|uniref:Lipoprotein n=1 Tax=Gordonia aichiensis NBRC 108223 TaxID=1220583 RepID=L7KLC9_9ACTN|nr:hypothetical protein GOACH_13_00150 [Gordonia aichiensis NBRC 108223]
MRKVGEGALPLVLVVSAGCFQGERRKPAESPGRGLFRYFQPGRGVENPRKARAAGSSASFGPAVVLLGLAPGRGCGKWGKERFR